ncbi:hypothetical protein HY386_01315 [Candidatus Daviesbacteria bacterium]|nr:hypothetical protein [Candidatus Daviesbacteria bacterium]
MKNKEAQVGLDDLKAAARAEQWDVVDENLPALAKEKMVADWAVGEGVNEEDSNIRDLAVSITEKSRQPLTEEQEEKLRSLMSGDPNQFVQFRAAFALFNRGDRSEEVIAKIQEAARDEDVEETAEDYLLQLDK